MLILSRFFRRCCVCAAVLFAAVALHGQVRVPAIFSNHMVLQAAREVPVWGWAAEGETVSVTVADAHATATAGADGKWMVRLDLSSAGQGPHRMRIAGKNEIVIDDVLIGQVWFASGQSNMNWQLDRSVGAKAEIAAGAGTQIREFRIRVVPAEAPRDEVSGQWVVATSGNTGGFSAVAYYFARSLQQQLQQPVGIICAALGATPVEAWTSSEGLAADPALDAAQTRRNKAIEAFALARGAYARAVADWVAANGVEDECFAPEASFAAVDADLSGWVRMRVGRKIAGKGLPQQGVIWLRRDIVVPAGSAGKALSYRSPALRGFATYYWNGKRISGPELWTAEAMHTVKGVGEMQRISIPGGRVKAGKNVLAIRVYAPTHEPEGTSGRHDIVGGDVRQALGGSVEWLAKAEKAFAPDPAALRSAPRQFGAPEGMEQQPSRLFNSSVAPVVPYAIAGFIWYQGESNVSRAKQYRHAFALLINDWRSKWGDADLPFYFCQLANFMAKDSEPAESRWAELRESQSLVLRLPHTGQAVLIDNGEADDIHPADKRDAGSRLARLALRNTYGQSALQASGPVLSAQEIRGNTIRLTFEDTGRGSELVASQLPETYPLKVAEGTTQKLELPLPDSPLQGFAVCGADGKWVWAHARIDGSHSVVVSAAQVAEPVAVRYAWANNPTCNLYNAAGLPASPFRTDDFQLTTATAGY